ncbi:MAG: hypothetical protein KJP00_05095, partial [Bacteroidia bacterium]|nr:hypothetical protein [Bacteroidia bacterium]
HPFKHYDWRYNGEKNQWQGGFGKLVLGETWVAHHGRHKQQSTRGIIADESHDHPLVNGIDDGAIWGPTDVYRVRTPLDADAENIIMGQTIDRTGDFDDTDTLYGMRESDDKIAMDIMSDDPEKTYNPNLPMPPLVWTKSYQLPGGSSGRALTSTIGASTDMLDEEVRRLFVNAVYHLLDMEVPEKANVTIVGSYTPSAFSFHDDEHWDTMHLLVEDQIWPKR